MTTVKSISDAFDSGRCVELKLALDDEQAYQGEIYLRVSPQDATLFQIGDCYVFKLEKIE